MSSLVKADGDTIVEWPYSASALRQDYPQVSFPRTPSLVLFNRYNVFEVQDSTPPTGEVVLEIEPLRINGVWTQQWLSRDYTAAEQISLDEQEALLIEAGSPKLFFKLIKAMVDANIMTVAQIPQEIKDIYIRWKELTGN